MRLAVATSIKQLIQIGLFLVALPLTVGLVMAIYQVDRLHEETSKSLKETTRAIAAGRSLVTLSLNMERIAGQFSVLAEDELLERYKKQRGPFNGTLKNLSSLSLQSAAAKNLTELQESEERLYQYLYTSSSATDESRPEIPDISLYNLANQLQLGINRTVATRSNQLEQRSKQVQRLLWIQALVLIPLAMFLLIVFGTLITRPMTQLSKAIRRMSAGNYADVIDISGPEDTRELGQRLDKLRQQLADLEQQKLTFLQHVSHELKTPLTSLREGVSLLKDGVVGPLTETQSEVVDILEFNGQQLQKEVEALLDFNQALRDEKLGVSENLELQELAQECIERQRLQLRARHIEMETAFDPALVHGDKKQLSTVMDNLLSNAIKYAPQKSIIRMQIQTDQKQATLDIIDSGPGINANEAEHIFEPFYQGAIARRGTVSGTGLGLAIVQRYITLHSGTVELKKSEQGAHFRVSIPLAPQG